MFGFFHCSLPMDIPSSLSVSPDQDLLLSQLRVHDGLKLYKSIQWWLFILTSHSVSLSAIIIITIIIIIYPLIVRVVGAPQMISQPVSSIFLCSRLPLGLGELQACPFLDVVFPPLFMSALSSSPFHCALLDGFGKTWWMGDKTIPLQFVSLCDVQEIFVWTNCLLDLGTDFLIGNMVSVWNA